MYHCLLIASFFGLFATIASQSYAEKSKQKGTAQDTIRSEAIARLEAGSLVRIQAQDIDEIEGRFLRSRDDSLFLVSDQGEMGVLIIAIEALWMRGRATKKGAKIGAISGGIIGGVGLGFLSWFGTGICEYECPEDETAHIIKGALFGMALGAGGGSLIGAGLGAATPKWHLRYRSPTYSKCTHTSTEKTAASVKSVTSQKIGAAWLYLGFTSDRTPGASGSSIGGRVNLFAEIHPNIAIGPEVGYYRLVPNVWHADATIRFASNRGRIRPFAIGGLGYYASHYVNYLGYGLGGGVQLGLDSARHHYGVEARWHGNIQRVGGPNPKFFTIMAGMSVAW